jgi:mercuric ion binding protein
LEEFITKPGAFIPCMRTLKHSIVILAAALLVALPMVAAEQQTLVLDIKGMHCTGCASGIEAMLKRVDGVTKADVSFEDRLATVAYDPAKANAEKIVEAIEKMGYKAAPKK